MANTQNCSESMRTGGTKQIEKRAADYSITVFFEDWSLVVSQVLIGMFNSVASLGYIFN